MSSLYDREARSVSTLAHLRFFPQAVVGGKGSRLRADDGRELIDFSASWGAASLGHAHPALRAAVDRALGDQAGASYLSTANEPATALAEALLARLPHMADGRVWLGHSGSDANETVARAVVSATGRKRIFSFEGAYHGGTAGSIAVSGHPVQSAESRAPGLVLVPYPHGYDAEAHVAAGEAVIERVEHQLATEVDPGDVAAFFIEPIQSDGGMLVPPDGFFEQLQAICRRHGILLVCDEVKVGLGRTGAPHAFAGFAIEPDIVVFGKGLGGGLPISAVAGPAAIMNHAAAFSFQTTHGNPVCAAAGLAVLETIENERLLENVKRSGDALRRGLDALAEKYTFVRQVRGAGLALGMELDGIGRHEAASITAQTVYRAFELGLVVYYVGIKSNVLEFTPALTVSVEEIEEGLALLDRALSDVAENRFDPRKLAAFAGW